MRLYILRHGETEWNKEFRLQGQRDIPLADEGIRLARATGYSMRDIPIDLVISSPLSRARQTAELVMEGRDVPFFLDDRIREISFGDWEGKTTREGGEVSENHMKIFFTKPLDCPAPPNGESFDDVCRRTGEFYQSLLNNPYYTDKSILVSTHGAAGRCLLNQFYEDKADIWRGNVPPNCSVCIVDIQDGVTNVIEKDKRYAE